MELFGSPDVVACMKIPYSRRKRFLLRKEELERLRARKREEAAAAARRKKR